MDDNERKILLYQMVEKNIYRCINGLTIIPLVNMREYCEKAGLGPNEKCRYYLYLPNSEEGCFNFTVGVGTDCTVPIEIEDVYYWDDKTCRLDEICGGETLYDSLCRDFRSGVDLCCGYISVDQFGGLYIKTVHNYNIVTRFRVSLTADSIGIQLLRTNGAGTFRIWSDGDYLIVAPTIALLYV